MRIFAACLLSSLAALAANCAAAPFAVQLGDTRVGMDAPVGFTDTGFTGSPRLQELAETLTSASNRILLFALTDADMRRFTQGDALEAKRYMIAVTPRAMETERISPSAFDRYVGDSLRELGKPPPTGEDPHKRLDASPGQVMLLAELRRDPNIVSVMQGVRLPPRPGAGFGEKPAYGLTTTTLMYLRGKALNMTVYSTYESAADIEWIRMITARWIEDLLRMNSR